VSWWGRANGRFDERWWDPRPSKADATARSAVLVAGDSAHKPLLLSLGSGAVPSRGIYTNSGTPNGPEMENCHALPGGTRYRQSLTHQDLQADRAEESRGDNPRQPSGCSTGCCKHPWARPSSIHLVMSTLCPEPGAIIAWVHPRIDPVGRTRASLLRGTIVKGGQAFLGWTWTRIVVR